MPLPPTSFIEQVAPTPDVASKLRSIGASSPDALLAALKAAGEATVRFLGPENAGIVERRLEGMAADLPGTEPIKGPGGMGAVISSPAPVALEAPYDVEQRNRLFDALQDARRRHAPTGEVAALEQQLSDLLRSH